jgi:hypothetical protein
MKEQRLTVEIDQDGRMTADADGFSGDACLKELEKLLEGLAPGTASIARKPDTGAARTAVQRIQDIGRRS